MESQGKVYLKKRMCAGWIDFNFAVGVVSSAEIGDEEKKKILWKNMKRILKQ